jgi:hypothetical protein
VSHFRKGRAFTGWRYVSGGLLGLALLGCEGVSGDVLWPPDPGAPLGAVPAGCADGHEQGSVCWQEDAWSQAATRTCEARGQALTARVLLDPCGPGFYRSVYYRCCPGPGT